MDLPTRIYEHDGAADPGLCHPGVEHRKAEQAGDPDPGRACPDKDDPRLGQVRPEAAEAGHDPGDDDGGGALDVVVE